MRYLASVMILVALTAVTADSAWAQKFPPDIQTAKGDDQPKTSPAEKDKIRETFERRKYDDAHILAEAYVQAYPNDMEGYSLLAGCQQKLTQTDAEKKLWRELLDRLDKDAKLSPEEIAGGAEAETRLRELDPAFKSLQEQQRGYTDSLKDLAEKEMRAGHYTFAMQMAEECVRLSRYCQAYYDLIDAVKLAKRMGSIKGTPIFNGKTTNGWKAVAGAWKVENGALLGTPDADFEPVAELEYGNALPKSFTLYLELTADKGGNRLAIPGVKFVNASREDEYLRISVTGGAVHLLYCSGKWEGGKPKHGGHVNRDEFPLLMVPLKRGPNEDGFTAIAIQSREKYLAFLQDDEEIGRFTIDKDDWREMFKSRLLLVARGGACRFQFLSLDK